MRLRGLINALLFLFLFPAVSVAQRNEFGIFLGGSTYFGDLNTNTSFNYTQPTTALYTRYNFDSRIAAKISFSYGGVKGMDSASNYYFERRRNLSFYSSIWEAEVQGEFNFMGYSSRNPKMKYSPYFLLGLGVFGFDPKTRFGDTEFNLQSIGTEGQGYPEYTANNPYKLTKPFWVVGGGFKWRVSKNFSMFGEAAVRKTFTDYLDDVSTVYPDKLILQNEAGPLVVNLSDRSLELGGQPVGSTNKYRGDQKKDNYLFIGVGFSFTINRYKCPFLYKEDY